MPTNYLVLLYISLCNWYREDRAVPDASCTQRGTFLLSHPKRANGERGKSQRQRFGQLDRLLSQKPQVSKESGTPSQGSHMEKQSILPCHTCFTDTLHHTSNFQPIDAQENQKTALASGTGTACWCTEDPTDLSSVLVAVPAQTSWQWTELHEAPGCWQWQEQDHSAKGDELGGGR